MQLFWRVGNTLIITPSLPTSRPSLRKWNLVFCVVSQLLGNLLGWSCLTMGLNVSGTEAGLRNDRRKMEKVHRVVRITALGGGEKHPWGQTVTTLGWLWPWLFTYMSCAQRVMDKVGSLFPFFSLLFSSSYFLTSAPTLLKKNGCRLQWEKISLM